MPGVWECCCEALLSDQIASQSLAITFLLFISCAQCKNERLKLAHTGGGGNFETREWDENYDFVKSWKRGHSGAEDGLHPAHFTIHQHDLDPVRMGGAVGQ